jgi:ABC-type branched-subunit amino acid transport system ATPase component
VAEQEKPRTAAEQVATADWKKIGDQLSQALGELGAAMREQTDRQREAREVAALFALYRRARAANKGGEYDETRRMITEALDGYPTALLADLIVFGEQLAHDAQPVWDARPIL